MEVRLSREVGLSWHRRLGPDCFCSFTPPSTDSPHAGARTRTAEAIRREECKEKMNEGVDGWKGERERGKQTGRESDCSFSPLQVSLSFPGNRILPVSPSLSPLGSAGSSLQGQQINLALTPPLFLLLLLASSLCLTFHPSIFYSPPSPVTFSWLHFKLRNGNINRDLCHNDWEGTGAEERRGGGEKLSGD